MTTPPVPDPGHSPVPAASDPARRRVGCSLVMVLLAIGLLLTGIIVFGIGRNGEQSASTEGTVAGTEVAATSPATIASPCDERTYHDSPSVAVSDTVRSGTVVLSRADFVVQSDCTVDMELIWQEQVQDELLVTNRNPNGFWCHILVAVGTGTSTPRGVFPAEIQGTLGGGTTGLDMACPGVDEPGNLDALLGGNTDAGQVGSYLSSASAEFSAEVEGIALDIPDLLFVTGYMTVEVDISALQSDG